MKQTYSYSLIRHMITQHRCWRDCRGTRFSRFVVKNADLRDMNFYGVELEEAIWRGSDLRNTDFESAKLTYADLRNVDFRGAKLKHCVLSGADLRGAKFDLDIPIIPDIDKKIAKAIQAGRLLDMHYWHNDEFDLNGKCLTTHCRAGWAVTLAKKKGAVLEHDLGCGTAAALIYAVSRPDKRVPDFYASKEEAMKDICGK